VVDTIHKEQQKNMMVQLGQLLLEVGNGKIYLAGCRNSNCSFSFWWTPIPPTTGATEEYDGTTWTINPPV
jgi:hypothetical protein